MQSNDPYATKEWTPAGLRRARDRVLTVIEPVWRAFYHRRSSERVALLVVVAGGGIVLVARRGLWPH